MASFGARSVNAINGEMFAFSDNLNKRPLFFFFFLFFWCVFIKMLLTGLCNVLLLIVWKLNKYPDESHY